MFDKKISVIVPIYNSEPFLDRCIQSIICQNFNNLEIILINDGSTDRSLNVCAKYAANDKRITVIDQENGGVAAARNRGLDVATGDYIGFVDSDDYISSAMYKGLLLAISENNADIAECGYCTSSTNYEVESRYPLDSKVISGSYECSYNYLAGINTTNFNVNKLYRRSLFDNLRYPNLRYSEDYVVNAKLFFKCRKKVTIDDCYYYYVQSSNSAVRRDFSEARLDIVKAGKEVLEFYNNKCPQLSKYAVIYILNNIRNLYAELVSSTFSKKRKGELAKTLINEYRHFYPLVEESLYETVRYKKTYVALCLFRKSPKLYYLVEKSRDLLAGGRISKA